MTTLQNLLGTMKEKGAVMETASREKSNKDPKKRLTVSSITTSKMKKTRSSQVHQLPNPNLTNHSKSSINSTQTRGDYSKTKIPMISIINSLPLKV